jgi:hypothetical protein
VAKETIVEGDLVYEVTTEDGIQLSKVVKSAFTVIFISGNKAGTVGVPITFQAEYRDWQGNPLPDENRDITIKITGEVPQEVTLTPTGGIVEFDFEGETPGTYEIRAEASFTHNPGYIKVVIQ